MARKKQPINNFIRAQQIAARKRRERVEQMELEGVFSKVKIAAALGVNVQTITADLKYIHEVWAKDDVRRSAVLRARHVRRMELAGFLAIQAFYASQQNAEEITTQYVPRRCKYCKGEGTTNGRGPVKKCVACKGEGTVIVEQVSKRMKGQAGDSSLLRLYKECMQDVAKTKGLYPKEPNNLPITNNTVHIYGGVDYSKADDELLLEAKQMLLRLTESAKSNVLDAESMDDENNTDSMEEVVEPEPGDDTMEDV